MANGEINISLYSDFLTSQFFKRRMGGKGGCIQIKEITINTIQKIQWIQ